MPLRAVAISGSPRAPSRSRLLAELALQELAPPRGTCDTTLVDVATLPAEALLARVTAPEIDEAIAAVGRAQIVVASTPTYRALYTGALKAFFDLMPQSHLAAKVCIGLQTGGSPAHALAPEHGLRPLFASLEGVPFAVLYATDAQFTEAGPDDDVRQRLCDIALGAQTLAQAIHGS
jgi:FMN reductase